jgi:hypothetical protein
MTRQLLNFFHLRTSAHRFEHFLKLTALYPSDKWTTHNFQKPYYNHFSAFRKLPLKMLEIGVGGYLDESAKYTKNDLGGESLRFWKAYFPNGHIYALDIEDKSALNEDRITIFRGDQSDPDTLTKLNSTTGGFDIVIDDGSHINSHVLTSFKTLFPLLSQNGIYVVEDCQTSYWDFDSYGGNFEDLNSKETIMGYFKHLADGINHAEFPQSFHEPTYFDLNIESIHFYHNIIFIHKGDNSRPSNMASHYPSLTRQ